MRLNRAHQSSHHSSLPCVIGPDSDVAFVAHDITVTPHRAVVVYSKVGSSTLGTFLVVVNEMADSFTETA